MISMALNIDYSAFSKKTDTKHFKKYTNAMLLDISAKWQRERYGVASAYNPSVNAVTRLTKGKDSPLLDSGQLRMSQRVEENNKGNFVIGTDKVYGAMNMIGGKWTTRKHAFVIPLTPEAKRMQKRLYFVRLIMAELKQKYNYKLNKSTAFKNSKGIFIIKKVGKTGTNWTRLFIFRKSITVPKRQIFYFSEVDKGYINAATKDYFESN